MNGAAVFSLPLHETVQQTPLIQGGHTAAPPKLHPCDRRMLSMNKTANFQLTQWEKTDRIMMEDFNRDNAAIDTALKGNADKAAALQTALASCGNCKIVYGTYTGNGKYGKDNPNQLTFDGNPLFVIIKGSIGSAPTLGIQAMRGWYTAYTGSADSSTVCHLTWGEHSLSWYNSQSSSDQFNTSDSVYPYIALFATQE